MATGSCVVKVWIQKPESISLVVAPGVQLQHLCAVRCLLRTDVGLVHGRLTGRSGRRRDDEGAVAIMVALSLTVLLVAAGMVVDFGLVRVDRQVNKSAADAATNAGLHALNTGDAKPHPAMGVCTALRFLRENAARYAGVTSATGTWKSGTGATVANGCTDLTLRAKVCTPGDPSSWVKYSWTGSLAGGQLTVTIESGYQIPAAATSPWSEDKLAAAQADMEDNAQGCDQLAVTISEHRRPGFGSLATNSDLVSNIRTVGRVEARAGRLRPGHAAPEAHRLPGARGGCLRWWR